MTGQVRVILVCAAAATLSSTGSVAAEAEALLSALEFRQIRPIASGSIAETGTAIPKQAAQAFVYEGAPRAVRVTERHIAVDYGRSGVLFDRRSGAFVRRSTIVDGWPRKRPEEFGPPPERPHRHMVGPGVLETWRSYGEEPSRHDVAVTAEFSGHVWKAMQPFGFLGSLHRRAGNDYKKMRELYGSWTGILRELNAESFLQAESPDVPGAATRYTMSEGLGSNIVTHLTVADEKLWAACVDIYDPQQKEWGPGGLCCFDLRTRRWERVDKIGGRTVRWVTLLHNVGDELWVGFCEGTGVVGDKVVYGMGLYPGQYRPETTAIVLGRLSNGRWSTFTRAPLPRTEGESPEEVPRKLAVLAGKVFLFSETYVRATGNWDVTMAGHISLLDPLTGNWRIFDAEKDFAAHTLSRMVVEGGEALAFTDRGMHRWSMQAQKWTFLDPQSPLRNPNLCAAVSVGKELWVGYTNQSFGVIGRQGISRFNEENGRWSYTPPGEIGTACPVRRIVPMPGGDVWVLFRKWDWRFSAMEFPFYAGEPWDAPEGLGRFSGGKWEFPVQLDGVPESRERRRTVPDGVRTWTEKLPIRHIAAVSGKLFAASRAGVYVGPGKWKNVLQGDVMGIEPSEDSKTLVIGRIYESTTPAEGEPRRVLQRGIYDPGTGELTFSAIDAPDHEDYQRIYDAGYLLSPWGDRQWRADWTRVRTRKQGDWAVGRLGGRHHAIVETPWAVWIASHGELIRLDRRQLAPWLGSGGD